MGILKKIFGKKEVSPSEETVEQIVEQPVEENDYPICTQCDMAIHPGQRVKTFAGKKMHMKPCWFKMKKTAKNFM